MISQSEKAIVGTGFIDDYYDAHEFIKALGERGYAVIQSHSVQHRLATIEQKVDSIMALEDDLNAAVVALATAFATLDTAVQAELVAIKAALAAQGASPALTDAVNQGIANIGHVTSSLAADAAKLTASLPTPVPPPAPPPAPPVPPVVVPPVIVPVVTSGA
jgi:hypothetical protein